ncbi:VanZ family protein [Arthrobacter sp. NPDC080073]|uniref:VanZ family protein n=1 Tax=Arthrobacter sp. NPDC080073 TaxID=3155919 RepID=UPI0034257887
MFAHAVICEHGETLATPQAAELQGGFSVDSTDSSYSESGLADHISDSAGRGFLRRGCLRADAALVKSRSCQKSLARGGRRRWSLVGYFVVLAFIAFWPTPVDKPAAGDLAVLLDLLHRNGIPEWINYGFVEASANILLFAPAGLLLALTLRRKRWWQLLALGAAISSTVELGQLLFLPHRFSSLQDILMNTLGVGLGLLVAAVLKWLPLSTARP